MKSQHSDFPKAAMLGENAPALVQNKGFSAVSIIEEICRTNGATCTIGGCNAKHFGVDPQDRPRTLFVITPFEEAPIFPVVLRAAIDPREQFYKLLQKNAGCYSCGNCASGATDKQINVINEAIGYMKFCLGDNWVKKWIDYNRTARNSGAQHFVVAMSFLGLLDYGVLGPKLAFLQKMLAYFQKKKYFFFLK